MKRFYALFIALIITIKPFCTYFNFPTALMYVPTTRTLDHLQLKFNLSQLMETTPFGYRYNSDWVEEDASIGFGLHLPFYNIKVEFSYVQYTGIQGVSGFIGAPALKINVFEEPLIRFEEKVLLENPKLKYLPSIAFGMRNIASNSMRYINPTGLDSQHLSNNSFFVVLSKHILNKERSKFMLSTGIGGRDFVGSGKMRNNGFFLGVDFTQFITPNYFLRGILEYSSHGVNSALIINQKNLILKIGFTNLQTSIRSLKEEKGIGINVAISYTENLQPVARSLGLIRSGIRINYKAVPHIENQIYDIRELARIRLDYTKRAFIPEPLIERIEEEIKMVRVDDGIQLQTKNIQFAANRSVIQRESFVILDNIASIIREYPNYSLIIEGHTDSSGALRNNYDISKSRAESVKSYILNKLNDPNASQRMFTFGFGPKIPVASNNTETGRMLNRRVDFYLFKNDTISKQLDARNDAEKSIMAELTAIASRSVERVEPPKREVSQPEPPKESFEDSINKMLTANNYTGAISSYEKRLSEEKSIPQQLRLKNSLNKIYFDYANELMKDRKLDEAKKFFEKTAISPNSKEYEEAYYILGNLEYNNDNFEKAVEYYRKVLENYKYFDPKTYDNDDDAMFKIIACLIKLGRTNDAKTLLENFSKTYPESELNDRVKILLDRLK